MKKIFVLLLAILMIGLLLAGCNQQLFDTTYSFEYGYISLPNGQVIEGPVSSWKDYENSDSIQVVIDGVTYYTHINNVVLVSK